MNLMLKIFQSQLSLLPAGSKIAIWGAGDNGVRVSTYIEEYFPHLTVRYFVDSNAEQYELICKQRVVFPSVESLSAVDYILVASVASESEILRELKETYSIEQCQVISISYLDSVGKFVSDEDLEYKIFEQPFNSKMWEKIAKHSPDKESYHYMCCSELLDEQR